MANIQGDQSNNTLIGNIQEDDTLTGLGGDDTLLGLSGNDTLDGGTGNDTLDGGEGDDLLNGGEGDDTYEINRDLGGVNTINDTSGNDIVEILGEEDPDNPEDSETVRFGPGLATPEEGRIGIAREGVNILIDVGANGIADDLIVENFFAATTGSDRNAQGAGFVETFGDTSGEDIQEFLAINEAPEAIDDTGSTEENALLSVDAAGGVLADDTDADEDDLTVSAVNEDEANVGNQFELPSGALLTLNADGSYEYEPNGAFDELNDDETDTDTFSYTVSDGNGGTDTADVTVTVQGITDDDTPFSLDVDENESLSSLNDGLSILRFTGGLTEAGFMAPAGDSELDGAAVLANIQEFGG